MLAEADRCAKVLEKGGRSGREGKVEDRFGRGPKRAAGSGEGKEGRPVDGALTGRQRATTIETAGVSDPSGICVSVEVADECHPLSKANKQRARADQRASERERPSSAIAQERDARRAARVYVVCGGARGGNELRREGRALCGRTSGEAGGHQLLRWLGREERRAGQTILAV